MLPPSWKIEIEDAVDKAVKAQGERQAIDLKNNAADIAAAIKGLGDIYQAQQNKPETPDTVRRSIDIATVVLLFATALFTALAWWVFNGQLHEMERAYGPIKESAEAARDSVSLAKDTAERQLRAYVGFDWGAILIDSPAEGKITAWIKLKNYGITPAYKVRGWMKFARLPTDANPFERTQPFENDSILEPASLQNLSATLANTPDQQQLVLDRKGSLFVWG